MIATRNTVLYPDPPGGEPTLSAFIEKMRADGTADEAIAAVIQKTLERGQPFKSPSTSLRSWQDIVSSINDVLCDGTFEALADDEMYEALSEDLRDSLLSAISWEASERNDWGAVDPERAEEVA